MERWTVDDVIQWLKVNGLEKYSQTFIGERLNENVICEIYRFE